MVLVYMIREPVYTMADSPVLDLACGTCQPLLSLLLLLFFQLLFPEKGFSIRTAHAPYHIVITLLQAKEITVIRTFTPAVISA